MNHLAQLLSLPVPPFLTVNIPQSFIDDEIPSSNFRIQPGIHFASLYLNQSKAISKRHPPDGKSILNLDMLSGVVPFDIWVSNSDRNSTNMLLEKSLPGKYFVYLIDHGNCFPNGLRWNSETLNETPRIEKKPRFLHRWFISLLENKEKLHDFLDKINRLDRDKIYKVIQSLPDEWETTEKEKEALFQHLVKGKDRLPALVSKFMMRHYPHKWE